MKKLLVFPGTFDPFTVGHASLVKRALSFADEVVIAIVPNSEKHFLFSPEKRLEMISEYYKEEERVKVMVYEGLTTDLCEQLGATAILRGVRTVKDLEYEEWLADGYRRLSGIETIVLFTEPQYASINSTLVREMIKYNKSLEGLITITDCFLCHRIARTGTCHTATVAKAPDGRICHQSALCRYCQRRKAGGSSHQEYALTTRSPLYLYHS